MNTSDRQRREQFERLLEPYLEGLFRFALRLTHARPQAEDLFQDVLVKVYERLDELAQIEDPRPWLNRVLYNRFIDDRRRYARRRIVDVSADQLPRKSVESLPDPATPPADILDNLDALQRALEQLSDEHRTIVLLHDAEGYKLKEIEAATGIAIGTIKSRLHRARARLRELLEMDEL